MKSLAQIPEFQLLLLKKSRELYRDMPWRDDTRPYYVFVSEIMLQQTQVVRVIPKFTEFIRRFPDVKSLAVVSLSDVVTQWQGLGYNRRAKYLHEAAKLIVNEYHGEFPSTLKSLMTLPGVGKNTAGAILAYSYNYPAIFIETNIRTVYIHHFFNDRASVDDTLILDKLQQTLDQDSPRAFYWALMDYGSWLKTEGVRNISKSQQYKKQATFIGSLRQTRGEIIRQLTGGSSEIEALRARVAMDERFDYALEGLIKDGLIQLHKNKVHLTK